MNYKKFLKYAGKTTATIACPPWGLALWPKTMSGKAKGAVAGLVLSVFASAGVEIGIVHSNDKSLYDDPKLSVVSFPNSLLRNFAEAFISPLALCFDNHNETRLEKDGTLYKVVGDEVITFNKSKYRLIGSNMMTSSGGKYWLDFGIERKFSVGEGYFSVKQAQEKIGKYEKLLDNYRQKGDIFSARRAKESLGRAEADLENITSSYTATKAEFQAVVDKMDSELETLAQTKD